MNLSLRHLKAFCALVETRSFTRAAERCNLTQSAFSALIANLEAGLGVRLFARSTRSVEPTAEGRVFEPMAARLVAWMKRPPRSLRSLPPVGACQWLRAAGRH